MVRKDRCKNLLDLAQKKLALVINSGMNFLMKMIKPTRGYVEAKQRFSFNKTTIISAGIPRSGSTQIYQMLCEIHPTIAVIKTHHFLFEEKWTKAVVTYRDFRDVIISIWRVEQTKRNGYTEVEKMKEETHFTQIINGKMTDLETETIAYRVKEHVKQGLYPYWLLKSPNVLILQYEMFFNNYEYLFKQLERFFKCEIKLSLRDKIMTKTNMEANRKRASQLAGFSEYNPETQIHGAHVYKGEIGFWKKFMSKKQIQIANDILEKELKEFGYEIRDSNHK